MQSRTALLCAAIAGFLSVALGAFGAHGLQHTLTPKWMKVYQTAVQYHQIHALVLLFVGLALQLSLPVTTQRWLSRSAILLLIGLVLFCGSLYLLATIHTHWLGIVTPIGGVSWLAAWLCIAMAAWSLTSDQP